MRQHGGREEIVRRSCGNMETVRSGGNMEIVRRS
jgi:hypothetical protein